MNAEEILGTARLTVRSKAPYFRAALLMLVPRPVPDMGTIGVTDNAILLYDPKWIEEYPPEEIAGALVHEIMHLLQRHMSRRGVRDRELWNIATDLAINPQVIAMGFKLPLKHGCLFPAMFKLAEGLTADEYYELLLQQSEEDPSGKAASEGKGVGQGNCGSCAGNPGDDEPAPGSAEHGEGKTPGQMGRIERAVADAVRDAAKARGTIPAALARWAETLLAPPKVPWRQKLGYLVRSACSYRAGAVVHKYDGVSRRQAGLGYGNMRPLLPRLRSPIPRVAVILDTSGSMSPTELGAGLREARGVLKAVGASVTFVACDAAVHGVKKCSTLEEMSALLKGGGGTDMAPAFAALRKDREPYDVIVCATDGCIGDPGPAPAGVKVIWLLLGKYRSTPCCSWGERIEVDD